MKSPEMSRSRILLVDDMELNIPFDYSLLVLK